MVYFFNAEINPTLAGVLLAMTIPATIRIDIAEFCELSQETINNLSSAETREIELPAYERYHSIVETLKDSCTDVQAPLRTIEKKLTPWVVYGIVSVFALANIGVHIGNIKNLLANKIVVGTILGLVIGKPLGLTLFSVLAVKVGLIELPRELTWFHILGISFLGGIAFTLPIFISTLTFRSNSVVTAIKIGPLIASFISSILGFITLHYAAKR